MLIDDVFYSILGCDDDDNDDYHHYHHREKSEGLDQNTRT